MPSPKSRRFGAVVATRYRDGTCTAACNRSGCRAYAEPRGWCRTVRLARKHAAAHAATDARYVGAPWGVPAHELAPARRRLHLGRLVVVALVLLVLAFTVTAVASHAAPPPPAPSYDYVPTPAGPPATDSGGPWTGWPDPAPPTTSAGGGR